MFRIRKMALEDFDFAVRLSDTMNWGLVEEDFEFMTKLEPDGCFVLLHDSERIGIATTISYGQVGWLGNVIVNEKYRRKGGGSLLVKYAIEYLTNRGVETIGLYGYLERAPFYAMNDFQYDSKFLVLRGEGFSAPTKARLKKAEKDDIQQIVDLDRLYFGVSRKRLLEPVLLEPENLCYMSTDGCRLLGFAVAKVYDRVAEIGPLVCETLYDDIAIDLLKAILERLKGYGVSMCVPEKESRILNMLIRYGFREAFPLARMFRGTRVMGNQIYVAESLERG